MSAAELYREYVAATERNGVYPPYSYETWLRLFGPVEAAHA